MINNANFMITIWHEEHLVSLVRCLANSVYVTYLANLHANEAF